MASVLALLLSVLLSVTAAAALVAAQQGAELTGSAGLDDEIMRPFQALVRADTTDPPGNEKPAANHLKHPFAEVIHS